MSRDETRTRILEAAWKLLSTGENTGSRMADIAKEAGVSRQAIYLHFASRAELLVATTRHIDDSEDVTGKVAEVLAGETGQEQLARFVVAWGNYIPIVYGGAKRLMAIRESDPDAHAAWQDRMSNLYEVCESIVNQLEADGDLADDLSKREAADIMWATLSISRWESLTIDRGLSQERYLTLTHRSLRANLIRDWPLG